MIKSAIGWENPSLSLIFYFGYPVLIPYLAAKCLSYLVILILGPMCFSAGASFGASAVLTVIGVATLKKVKSVEQLPFASIPLVFAIQQFSEGFVWLSLSNPAFASLEKLMSYTFLVFAQLVWPLLVPIAITLLEKNVLRRKIMKVFVGIGVLVTAYFAHRLIIYGAKANIDGHHIMYLQVYPDHWNHVADMLYGVATLIPTFFSTTRRMWFFGLVLCISYLVAAYVYTNYILSVWCFFSSLMSILIFFIIKEISKLLMENR